MAEASPLGNLAKLPYEIRLILWDYVFCVELHQELPVASEQLGILRTSRAIHDEITNRPYNTIDIHIPPVLNEPMAAFPRIRSAASQPAVRYKDNNFFCIDFEEINLVIHLYAPDPRDPGQLVLMYERATKLMNFLPITSYKHVDICYDKNNNVDWQTDGKPHETVKYPVRHGRPDRNVVLIPFFQMEGVKSLEIIPSGPRMKRAVSHGFINHGREFINQNGYKRRFDGEDVVIFPNDPKYATISHMFRDVQQLAIDMEFFLDTQLDHLPGHTADMLRSRRFARWFRFDSMNDQLYTSRTLYILRYQPKCVTTHDPGLFKLLNRYNVAANIALAIRPCFMTWREPLYKAYPKGLLPFPPVDREQNKKNLIFAKDFYNLGALAAPSTPLDGFYVDFMRWRSKQWPKKYRLPRFSELHRTVERYWCDLCDYIGFETWCDNCEGRWYLKVESDDDLSDCESSLSY